MRRFSANCERARASASRRLDGELSEFERELLDAHAARCESCAEFVRDIHAATALLRRAELEQLPAPVVLPSRRRVSPSSVRIASVAAAAALAVVGLGPGLIASLTSIQSRSIARGNAELNPVTGGENVLVRQVRLTQIQGAVARNQPRRGLGLLIS